MKRVRSCGQHSVRVNGEVAIRARLGDGGLSAGVAGVATCGSVWSCPVCSRKIAAARQAQIEQAVTTWEGHGGAVAMGTFTVSHTAADRLVDVWSAVSTGWARVTAGKAWKSNQARYGVEGWLRLVEVKHGANGWHVHVHVLFFLHHPLDELQRELMTAALLGRWRAGIGKHGYSASDRHGADIRMLAGGDLGATVADYFAKSDYRAPAAAASVESAASLAGLEMARGDLKVGGDSRTPFELLYQMLTATDGGEDFARLWAEWEKGSKGRRQLTWSKGLREFLRLTDALREDEDIAREELGTAADDVAVVTGAGWKALRWIVSDLLDVIEVAGVGEARAWLDGNGIEWRRPGAPTADNGGRRRPARDRTLIGFLGHRRL